MNLEKIAVSKDSEITLTNNEIKEIIKVLKSSENRGISLERTIKKVKNQKGGFLGSLMRLGLPLIKNVLTPLAKNVLLPLEVTAATPATDAAIQKKIYELRMTTLIISNEEMEGIMKIFKSLEESCQLTEGVSETTENEIKRQISWNVIRHIRS